MKHRSSNVLFRHWNERRGSRAAPERVDIDPRAVRRALGDVFVLAWDARYGHTFRLAGTRVCALFGRELRGEIFSALWSADERPQIQQMLRIIRRERMGVVAGTTGQDSSGFHLELELLLLPLVASGPTEARMIGSLAAVDPAFQAGASCLERLHIQSWRCLDDEMKRRQQQPIGPGLRSLGRQSFTVYQGGRS